MQSSVPSTTVERPDARVDRVLTERLLVRNTPLRLIALLLWAVFGLAYWDIAPWWMIAAPATLHVGTIFGFLGLARARRRDPDARTNEGWRRRYILYAGLTGVAYGGGGALLYSLPYSEPRILVAAQRLGRPLHRADLLAQSIQRTGEDVSLVTLGTERAKPGQLRLQDCQPLSEEAFVVTRAGRGDPLESAGGRLADARGLVMQLS